MADRQRRGLEARLDERDREPLIMNRHGRPYSRFRLWALVRRVAERADIRKRVSTHWLRHTFGTLAALADVPVYQIQQDMGHADISTSQRYVHWATGLKGAGAFAVADALFGEGVD